MIVIKKNRFIYLDELPKKYGIGANKNKLVIDWKNSVGYKVKFFYNDIEGYIKIIGYNIKSGKLNLEYNNKIYSMDTYHFNNCELGKVLNKYTNEFKIEIGQTFKDDKRDIIITDRKRGEDKHKYYKYYCNKCGFDCGKYYSSKDKQYVNEKFISEYNLLKGQGCLCCANQIVVKGINDIATTHPKMIQYFVNKEDIYTHSYSSNEKILMKCPNCGYIKKIKVYSLLENNFACERCGDGISYPNKFMFALLEQLNINFETEKQFKWCKYYNTYKDKYCIGIYDFYIPSKQLIIEMDGAFHNKDNNMTGQTKEESKFIDDCKDKLAEYNNLKVIRIDCNYNNNDYRFDYIKNNIINSELNKIFNLNNIDWIIIEKKCEKSKVKEICDFWRIHNNVYNENITIEQICSLFKKNKNIVKRYLRKGNKFGWCDY